MSSVSLPKSLAQSGTVDTNFNPGTGVDIAVYSVVVQTNGQILIGGDFTSYNNVEYINLVRLNADGSADTNFNPGTALSASFPFVNAMALQPAADLIVGGSFSTSASTNVAGFRSTGFLDSSFRVLANDTVNAVLFQTNGSILYGGFFTNFEGQPHTGLARTDGAGNLDGTFNPVLAGGFATIYALALQNDGKILIAGSFTNVNGSDRTNIARLNPDGSLDGTFQPVSMGGGSLAPALPGLINAVAVDSSGAVLAGGDFASINGQVRTNLARFASNGAFDQNFNPAAGTDFAVNALALEPFGGIFIGGSFNKVNGVTNNYIAKLNPDGTLDSTFDAGSGASDVVYALALQPDGNVLIAGAFTEVDGLPRGGIARLLNVVTVSSPRLVNPTYSNQVFRVAVVTFSGKSYVLQYKNSMSDTNWTSLPAVPGDGTVKTLTDASATVARRFYRVQVQ